ncbi:MAG TPA: OsmC family protein [Stellaceae bacterium]|nr:OsmC family protein [Stellaceae bacterium]
MKAEELREMQAPFKALYRDVPEKAVITLKAQGRLGEGITCKVETGRAGAEAGLHPATGGDGIALCSGDMLLEALVACAGVTMNAVATALELPLRGATVKAEGDLDFRGTLGIDKTAPVGFREIRLSFDIDSDATRDQLDTLMKLTERYCVVFQTLNKRPELKIARRVTAQ